MDFAPVSGLTLEVTLIVYMLEICSKQLCLGEPTVELSKLYVKIQIVNIYALQPTLCRNYSALFVLGESCLR